MRAALAARDIGTLYRLFWRAGVSQRQIAQRTGQSQPEVSEIINGRQVHNVWVLERIADGLGIPRARMGLSYGDQGPDSPAAEEVDEDVKRRVLIAAALGQTVRDRGEPIEVALPPNEPLPYRLSMAHVHEVRTATERLRGMGRYYGGQADLFRNAVRRYTRWMQVPAPEPVRAALAELHTEAGWRCHDSGLDGTGYFTRGLHLAHQTKDTYGIAYATWSAGGTLVRDGHPNDALKLFQAGWFSAIRGASRAEDPRLPNLVA